MKPIRDRKFWIVSPNVVNRNKWTPEWVARSLRHHAAFIGFRPTRDYPMGYKFAEVVNPGDVILIARRYKHAPHLVGVGVVDGPSQPGLKGLTPLLGTYPRFHGSRRMLSPFTPVENAPSSIDIMYALRATMAMHRLHPKSSPKHRIICDWMQQLVGVPPVPEAHQDDPHRVTDKPLPPGARERGYFVMSKREATFAENREERLVEDYRSWLRGKKRSLHVLLYEGLRCDAFEKARQNLIEAKSSIKREHIRMAVGQLLDYEFLGRDKWDKPHRAILVPQKPAQRMLTWLASLQISVVWREGNRFTDNARGQFT